MSRLVCSNCGGYVDLAARVYDDESGVERCKSCGQPTDESIGEDEE